MSAHAWLARHVTYPAYERMRGRSTLRELAALETHARQSLAAVGRIVDERLSELLAFADKELPYYRKLFAACGIEPIGNEPLANLSRLPVLSKSDVRANADDMIWRNVPGGPIPHSSGGTTGDTLHFFIDRTRQAQTHAARLFMQRLFGIRLGQRRVHLWGSPIENRPSRWRPWRDRLLNEFVLNAFEMSPAHMDAHLDRLAKLQPRVLYGYPSALALLSRHAAQSGRRRGFERLGLIVMTGEEITPQQKADVREVSQCSIAAEYGSRETGLIAHECPAGGLHVLSPHVHVEIERDGLPAPRGTCGNILCTTLNARAQPLIRYRIGDAGSLLANDCECGLPFPLLRIDGGKVTGFIALADGRLCHGAVTSHILRGEPGIVEFKTHQRTLDRFDILLVVNDEFDAITIERVASRYRELFGSNVDAQCCVVDRIDPDPSGKRRYVVSDVVSEIGDRRVTSVLPTGSEFAPAAAIG